MQNDSKLGMLAGVGGVVVAAVLLSRNPPAGPSVPAPIVQSAAKAAPAPANAAAVARVPAPSTPVARGRPEIEGKTASRSSNEDDE